VDRQSVLPALIGSEFQTLGAATLYAHLAIISVILSHARYQSVASRMLCGSRFL